MISSLAAPKGAPSLSPVSYTHLDVYKRQLLTLPGERRKDPHWRTQAINGCDVAILCLPA